MRALGLLIAGLIPLLLLLSCSNPVQLRPLPPDAVVLAYGDSLTFGTGAAESESYPAVLETLIGRRVIKSGVPGEISEAGVARLPELLDREHPALLILCHGGNDLLRQLDREKLAANLTAMIKLAKERDIDVLLLGVPTLGLSLTPPPLYAEIAQALQITVNLKALPRILGKGSLKSDYIHPNAAGYRQLAEAVAKTLKKYGALNN